MLSDWLLCTAAAVKKNIEAKIQCHSTSKRTTARAWDLKQMTDKQNTSRNTQFYSLSIKSADEAWSQTLIWQCCSVPGNQKHLLFDSLTSWTEKDPLVDDIITLRSLLSIAKVIKARLSWWKWKQRNKFSKDYISADCTVGMHRKGKVIKRDEHQDTYHQSLSYNILKWNLNCQ